MQRYYKSYKEVGIYDFKATNKGNIMFDLAHSLINYPFQNYKADNGLQKFKREVRSL